MFLIIVCVSLLGGSFAALNHKLLHDERLVGGFAGYIEQFPYMVSLHSGNSPICGGAIIDKKWVITAAHCTNGRSALDLSIRAGSNTFHSNGVVVQIKEINQHPDYDPASIINDISVLELEEELIFGEKINNLNLPVQDQSIEPGTWANVTGFGKVYQDGNYPAVLLVINIPTISLEDCRKAYGEIIDEHMFCAGFPSGDKDVCEGDGGSPLVIRNELIGIVSSEIGCGRSNLPGLYTDVAVFRTFIADITGY